MNAIVYCRVSTDKKEQDTSLSRQEDELTKAALERGFTIVKVIKERHSGFEFDRDGITEILDLFRTKQADVLLIQDETRMGRGNAKLALIHQLRKFSVQVQTLSGSGELELSDMDSMVLDILSMVEEYQRSIHNKKIQRGVRKAMDEGFVPKNNLIPNAGGGKERIEVPIEQIVFFRDKKEITYEEMETIFKGLGFEVSRSTLNRRYLEYKKKQEEELDKELDNEMKQQMG